MQSQHSNRKKEWDLNLQELLFQMVPGTFSCSLRRSPVVNILKITPEKSIIFVCARENVFLAYTRAIRGGYPDLNELHN